MAMERLPSIKGLQVFVVTAEVLNFTHATEELNMTQGAISRQIQALEALLEVKLFERLTRRLVLTQAGEQFLVHAKSVLAELQLAKNNLTHAHNTIRICAPSCISSWLLQRIALFGQQYPDYEVELTATTKHSNAADLQHFDLWIRYSETPHLVPFQSRLLFKERLSPVVSQTLWQSVAGDSMQKLAQLTWLHPSSTQQDWRLWLTKVAPDLQAQRNNQHFATLDQAVNAAMSGFGIAMGDIELASNDLTLGRLIRPFEQSVESGKSYFLSSLSEQQRDAVIAFERFLFQSEQNSA